MIPLACPPDAMYPIQLAECGRGKRLLFAARPGTSGHARPSTTADTRPATGLLPGGGGAPARAVGTPQGGPREGSPPVSRLPPAYRAAPYYQPVPPPGPPDLSSGPDHRRRAVASQHHRRFPQVAEERAAWPGLVVDRFTQGGPDRAGPGSLSGTSVGRDGWGFAPSAGKDQPEAGASACFRNLLDARPVQGEQ